MTVTRTREPRPPARARRCRGASASRRCATTGSCSASCSCSSCCRIASPVFLTTRNLLNIAGPVGDDRDHRLRRARSCSSPAAWTCRPAPSSRCPGIVAATTVGEASASRPAMLLALVAALGVGIANGSCPRTGRINAIIATLAVGHHLPRRRGVDHRRVQLVRVDDRRSPCSAAASSSASSTRSGCSWARDRVTGFCCGATRFGRYIYAAGGNPEAARLSGVRSDSCAAPTFVISGLRGRPRGHPDQLEGRDRAGRRRDRAGDHRDRRDRDRRDVDPGRRGGASGGRCSGCCC